MWEAGQEDGDRGGVFARRFDASGQPLGSEFRLNSEAAGHQHAPQLMASGVGTLVAAWQDGAEGEGQTIVLQRFNAQAKAVGREIRIPVPDGDGDLYLNDLRVAHGGDFSVTSIHYDRGLVQRGIRMHGFDVAGNPVR